MKLKPCPFCVDGGKPRIKHSLAFPDNCVWVTCEACGVSIGTELSEENAVKTWNTRYIEDKSPLTLEELREMDGEPVFLAEEKYKRWVLITDVFEKSVWIMDREGEEKLLFEDYKKAWLAYRRKPEEGTT